MRHIKNYITDVTEENVSFYGSLSSATSVVF